jgi:F-type H+-transporting ATPase subunit alpha
MMEMLKQPVNAPITFDKQVVLIYAGIKWYLDVLPVESISVFESSLYDKLNTSYTWLCDTIKEKRKLDSDIEEQMTKVK